MTKLFDRLLIKIKDLIPLLILFYLSLSEINLEYNKLNFSSTNLAYIIIYYWVLKNPSKLAYGYIFFAGVLSDVVAGLPMGTSALIYLSIASVAAYVRNVTVTVSLFSDCMTFLLAMVIAFSITLTLLSSLSSSFSFSFSGR